ncbi:hypothetical protein CHS0354_018322 [Potamilus streckersoni]|uniref:Phosphatidylinositol-4-phosphate 3-kinase n=1 Tax=Potamilus streckersoni TaxID=2493646 RepID=A0AAE0WEE9_9BIVA|nr:hypothetical protein CHS0354_018322 [Potamilus streckersoni]
MSARGDSQYTGQGGIGGWSLNPPPVPPRTYQQIYGSTQSKYGSQNLQGYTGQRTSPSLQILDGYQAASCINQATSYGFDVSNQSAQTDSIRHHQYSRPQDITVNRQRQSMPLISLSPQEEKSGILPKIDASCTHIMDLEGIDFNHVPNQNEKSAKILSSSMEDISQQKSNNLYPDISGAFKELRNEQKMSGPQKTEWNSQFNIPNFNLSMPKSYGWDPNLLDAGKRSILTPSVPVTTPTYMPNVQGYGYRNMPGCDLQGYSMNPFLKGQLDPWGQPVTNQSAIKMPQGSSSTKLDSWNQERCSFNDFDDKEDNVDFQVPPRINSDLIELGFEGVMTHEEKEYFSLEYFDPLHQKARSDSLSMREGRLYSFAKPPEDTDSSVAEKSTAWVTFDEDGFFKSETVESSKKDTSVEKTESSEGQNNASNLKRYEKLHTKFFVDEESAAFGQMVADLKGKYKFSDRTTNLGFIVSPVCDKQQESISIKIIVHTDFSEDPFIFTSDVNSLVDHVISHVIYSCFQPVMPKHMMKELKTEDFILKVFDRSEYLLNDYPLSKFEYTHYCLKMDVDIRFKIMRRLEVALPFLRTEEDDSQHLYFPQDNNKETDVTRDDLEILMEVFYKEVEKVSDFVLRDDLEKVNSSAVSQSVKAICNKLHRIETIDIRKTLIKMESTLNQLLGKTAIPQMQQGTLLDMSLNVKVALVPQLEEAIEQLVNAVKQLVRIYCQAFHTDFHLGFSIDQPWDPQEISRQNEIFIVHVATVHQIPIEWPSRYDEYQVTCSLFHGKQRLSQDVVTTCASVNDQGLMKVIVWDEWLTFEELTLCMLPWETRLCITLQGLKTVSSVNANTPIAQKITTPIGGVTVQLFSKKGYLLQGSQLVPLRMNVAADPVTPFCSTLTSDSALLQFNLPDFGRQILFVEPLKVADIKKKHVKDLLPEIQDQIKEIMAKDCADLLTADQLETLWSCRHYLTNEPRLLPWILQGAHGWNWACLPDINWMLQEWKTLEPMQSLELLLPQYPDGRVRAFAVDCLRRMPTDDLIDFIPQLIQALKFESYHSSDLAKLLLEQSCKSVRFAHQFFWLLKGATQDILYKRRYELMFVALISVAGDALYKEFKKQEKVVKILSQTGESVQKAKDKDVTLKKDLQKLYEKFEEEKHILLPYNPGIEVSGIDLQSCSYFSSNALPLKLVFKNAHSTAGAVYAMFKVGDDLRQDMLTMQIIKIMDRLWLREGLDLKMITFSCLPTGPRRGFVEIITESDTLRKIQISSGLTGSFKDRPIKEWLQRHNPTELEYLKAVENFTRSCAGYCVATYVLGVCDRHNDNIMLKQSGHMFHIDFNKLLGDSQMFGNIKRDRVKFVLTSDMAYVINNGERQNDRFQHFVDMCCTAFNILRKHSNLFFNLFSLMLRSGIPGITEKGIEFIPKALLPGYTDTQAAAEFTRMIEESLSAKSTQINFFIHNLAQMKFSSHNEGALLSFVPKVYSQRTDGKIKRVEVYGIQKRYQPEKHYVYILKIERENQKLPSYIFRLYEEIIEFRNKLVSMFPLINFPQLSGRVILGRSHVKTVAEARKVEIEKFLQELWHTSSEVSHCDIVYTFFHTLLRDEQESYRKRLSQDKVRGNSVQLVKTAGNGLIKLSIEYVKDSLHIMIMHVKDLPTFGSDLPSPYVKMYLLPDPEKLTKRKTKIIKHSTHPTYNELIEYKMKMEEVCNKILQVTVWNHDVLMENSFLGAVYIKLRDLELNTVNTSWHKLDKLQMDPNLLS